MSLKQEFTLFVSLIFHNTFTLLVHCSCFKIIVFVRIQYADSTYIIEMRDIYFNVCVDTLQDDTLPVLLPVLF